MEQIILMQYPVIIIMYKKVTNNYFKIMVGTIVIKSLKLPTVLFWYGILSTI